MNRGTSRGAAADRAGALDLGGRLGVRDVAEVARRRRQVAPLSGACLERVETSRAVVEGVLESDDRPVYGITTGYGALAGVRIRPEDSSRLSCNVILKCAVGVGDPMPEDWTRAMLLARARSLSLGCSGVRPVIVDTLVEMLNRGVTPVVPQKGSLGASGDLAPLAHAALVATRAADEGIPGGSGEAWWRGERMSGARAMREAGIERPVPLGKEGLGLTNGSAFMTSGAALALCDSETVLRAAVVAAALSFEALRGRTAALDERLNAASVQSGQMTVAAYLRDMLQGSRLIEPPPGITQDAYSLRCTPQVLGPVADMLGYLASRVGRTLNAANDNPLVFPADGDRPASIVQGGNFHGAGPALWLDTLGIAMCEVASISDRRSFRMLTPELSRGLPSMLSPDPGLNGGMMSVQYTGAALVSDNKTLASPDSVDSIPTSANQEDHVSMGANAARRCREIISNVRTVVAIELLLAAQGVWLRPAGPESLSPATRMAYDAVRAQCPPLETDRPLAAEIDTIDRMIASGEFTGPGSPVADWDLLADAAD